MPNNIKNVLTVEGASARVAEFVEMSKIPRPLTKERLDSVNYQVQAGEREPTLFDFHGVVPLPESYSKSSYSEHGYYLEQRAWGVKWGPYEVKNIKIEDNAARYEFTTAWGPAVNYLEKASLKFPQLVFWLSYGGEGPTRGYIKCQNGEFLQNWHDEYKEEDWPNEEDFDSDNDYCKEYKLTEQVYVFSHDLWVEGTQDRNA